MHQRIYSNIPSITNSRENRIKNTTTTIPIHSTQAGNMKKKTITKTMVLVH